MTIFLIYKALLVLTVFGISMGVAAYSTYAERKISAFMQDRVGPDRAGPFGLLQPLADGLKLFMKEELIPTHSNKGLFILGPSLAMLTALMTGAVIPWGGDLRFGEKIFPLQVADINIGILYILGVVSIGVYGIMLGGWASNNKYALMGAIRASSQMISYEIAMGLSLIGLIMMTGSLSLRAIADTQIGLSAWNVWYQPLGFLIFFISALAECNRAPFDLPECESELVGGYHTEYSSMKFGIYLFAEYINMFISAAVISTLYFGSFHVPIIGRFISNANLLTLLGVGFVFLKIFFFIFVFMWIRWTLPRFRYDQLMTLGWKFLIPLSIFNIFVTGCVMWFHGDIT
jgi:NADH-quinone oxidoreductase subunit H